jgi:hypothetical protein
LKIVMQCQGYSNFDNCSVVGQFLKSFDPEANEGRGNAIFTKDPMEAIMFESGGAALEYWQTQSTTVPLRPDGKPNRPLTSFHMLLAPLGDFI